MIAARRTAPSPEPTAAPIDRMDAATAAAWTRLVSDALIAGRVSLRFADEAVATLTADGFHDLAAAVKCAAYTRQGLLRSRGFAHAGGAR